ncbi:MAG: lipid-A-disaccharide synthase [Verrucomicrobia bacterium]|nr:lipid-A-disaccharide synthase [Verrucomicrobiota bacterium]MBI3871211.1 lipid-A-disaccharide synthase [Verrucomicrobiota bacterium]
MIIAGEPSGDALAAELATALRTRAAERGDAPLDYFGAGGAAMRQAGIDVRHDLASQSVIGPFDLARRYLSFRKVFFDLLRWAEERRPELVILVDYSHFNHRFAAALRQRARKTNGAWSPKIVKYVSPQVWASRPGRARAMERDLDLLLCLFPFEPAWYAARAPSLPVRYVGHPVLDRYPDEKSLQASERKRHEILLLPGSREGELRRHWPVMAEMTEKLPDARFIAVLPNESLLRQAREGLAEPSRVTLRVGGLAEGLRESWMAVASTGSVTMECACFGIPTVALYKTSFLTYAIGKRLVNVRYLAMPNILADREVMPEFVQGAATAENLARAARTILDDDRRWTAMREDLRKVIATLGAPGASIRAAEAIQDLMAGRTSGPVSR